MTALVNSNLKLRLEAYLKSLRSSLAHTLDDIAQGFFEISHNSFALLGLAVVFGVITLTARPDLRDAGESRLMTWLQERRDAAMGYTEPRVADGAEAVAVAARPKELSRQQAAVASWLSRKYGVAQEPLSVLVAEAFEIGHKVKLDPTLILAIMAIESGFNPFAQSPVGAQGLMQVMTQVHQEKYENLGGKLAAFDPVTNLRVGVKVLQECIARAGSIEGGLKYYVGAANLESDGGYASKVMAEHSRLLAVVGGKAVSVRVSATSAQIMPLPTSASTPTPPSTSAPAPSPAKLDPTEADEKVASLARF